MLSHSYATLHDETGLRPRYYNASHGATDARWVVSANGRFLQFENREVFQSAGPHMVHSHTVHLPPGALLIWCTVCGNR